MGDIIQEIEINLKKNLQKNVKKRIKSTSFIRDASHFIDFHNKIAFIY